MPKDPTLYNELISGTYFNGIRFNFGGDAYVGNNPGQNSLTLVTNPVTWVLQRSHSGPFTGYWIYTTSGEMCWQAENDTGDLVYWNWDKKAKPNTPQDYEIFYIRKPANPALVADPTINAVSIKHVHEGDDNNWIVWEPSRSRFHAGMPAVQASVFYVEFEPSVTLG